MFIYEILIKDAQCKGFLLLEKKSPFNEILKVVNSLSELISLKNEQNLPLETLAKTTYMRKIELSNINVTKCCRYA